MNEGSSRKRSRSSGGAYTPPRGGSGGSGGGGAFRTAPPVLAAAATIGYSALAPHLVESSDDKVRASQLRDPKQRIKALNSILRLTSSHEQNYALSGDSVCTSLLQIAMECLHWDPRQMPPACRCCKEKSIDDGHGISDKRFKTTQDISDYPISDAAGSGIDGNEDEDEQECKNKVDDNDQPVFSSFAAWKHPPTKAMRLWVTHCRQEFLKDSKNRTNSVRFQTLEVIVAIFRNLSFVGANLRMLAYRPAVLCVLMACLYETHVNEYGASATTAYERPSRSGHLSTPALAVSDEATKLATSRINLQCNALQTLIHLVPYMDVSGQKLLADKLFYPPTSSKDGPMVPDAANFGQAASGLWGFGGMWLAKRLDTKEDSLQALTANMSTDAKEFLLQMTGDYLVAVWSIFSALGQILVNSTTPRAVLMTSMDFLLEWINLARAGLVGPVVLETGDSSGKNKGSDELPTVRAILVSMPEELLSRLVDFLYIPRLGPDSTEYLDPVHNIVTRVTTLRLQAGYDSIVDVDLRDRALEILVLLMELDSPRMAVRLGMLPDGKNVRSRLWDAVLPALTGTTGRSETTVQAAQLLRELSKARPQNQPALDYIQPRLVEMASRDHRVANLVWSHLYAPGVQHASTAGEPSDEDNKDDEEGQEAPEDAALEDDEE